MQKRMSRRACLHQRGRDHEVDFLNRSGLCVFFAPWDSSELRTQPVFAGAPLTVISVWKRRYRVYPAAMTRHCWKCGAEYKLAGSPGRSETCDNCGADLKVCLNCVSHDPKVAYHCRDRRAELVEDKRSANYCEYFELARRVFVPQERDVSRQDKAREQLKKLLGD